MKNSKTRRQKIIEETAARDEKTRKKYRKKSAKNRIASEKEVAARSALKKELKRQRSGSSVDSKKILTKKPNPSEKSSDFNIGAYSRSKADWTSKETPNYLGDDIGKTSPVWND